MKDPVEYDETFVLMARLTLLGLHETVFIAGNMQDYRFDVRDRLMYYTDKKTHYVGTWHWSTLKSIIGILE